MNFSISGHVLILTFRLPETQVDPLTIVEIIPGSLAQWDVTDIHIRVYLGEELHIIVLDNYFQPGDLIENQEVSIEIIPIKTD